MTNQEINEQIAKFTQKRNTAIQEFNKVKRESSTFKTLKLLRLRNKINNLTKKISALQRRL